MTIEFKYQPAIFGTIIDGSTGTIVKNGEIVADFIELDSEFFFATDLNGNDISGTRAEVESAFA